MKSPLLLLIGCGLVCGMAWAGALRPIPGVDPRTYVDQGLEVNRGQGEEGFLFFNRTSGVGVTANSILYSPKGIEQVFATCQSAPGVSWGNALPGVVNHFQGKDAGRWVQGAPRVESAAVAGGCPGVTARYRVSLTGKMVLTLELEAGVDPAGVEFEMRGATVLRVLPDGVMWVSATNERVEVPLHIERPVASSGSARIELVSATRWRIRVDGRDSSRAMTVAVGLMDPVQSSVMIPPPVRDGAGNLYFVASRPAVAGRRARLARGGGTGCALVIATALPCLDVAVHRFTPAGELAYITYLAGDWQDEAGFLGLAPDGTLAVAGETNSADFPVSATALQREYAGPGLSATESLVGIRNAAGDLFAARVESLSGRLLASTYFGGPGRDEVGTAAVGRDGTVYFLPGGSAAPELPVSAGALVPACGRVACVGYAARLSPALDRMVFGTYLPEMAFAAAVDGDGSVVFGGGSAGTLPVTEGAYQSTPYQGAPGGSNGQTGFVARLNGAGTGLVFATYVAGDRPGGVRQVAVGRDGSIWAGFGDGDVFVRESRVVRLDERGSRLLGETPFEVTALAGDAAGNLYALGQGVVTPSANAFLSAPGPTRRAYLRFNSAGELAYASYLPEDSEGEFWGMAEGGAPGMWVRSRNVVMDEAATAGTTVSALVDSANLYGAVFSPGHVVTLFGARLGPEEGVAFQLEGGRVPARLAGTRVLVDGVAAPLLYVSATQVNAILPYSLTPGSRAEVKVEVDGAGSDTIPAVVTGQSVTFYLADRAGQRAAALNEDGSVNSPANPARLGSVVTLFGTGGGVTVPPGEDGEVTPAELRRLARTPGVSASDGASLTVEFAGAAPGLVAGVIQVNVRLPERKPSQDGELLMLRVGGELVGIAVREP